MPFDPSIISQIPDMAPNPVAATEQGYKLSDMATGAQANRLQLGQQKQEIADKEKTKNILKGMKLDTPQDVTKAAEKLNHEGLHDEAMQFMKAMQGLQESKGNLQLQQYQLLEAKSTILAKSISGLVNEYESRVDSGASPTLAASIMQPKYQEAIQQLRQTKLSDGSPALDNNDLAKVDKNPKFDINFLKPLAEQNQSSAAALKIQQAYHKQGTEDKSEKNRERATDIAAKREEDYSRSITDRAKARESGLIDDEDATFNAKRFLAGDKTALQGVGRGPAAAQNYKIQQRAIRMEAQAQHLSPQDIAARMGEYAAFMNEERAVGTREAQIQIASTEADKVFPIVEKAAKAVPRGKWVPVNRLIQDLERWHSDKDLGKFAQAIDTTVNVYARAISPTGVPHEAARQRALKLLSTATDEEAFEGIIDIMKSEIKAAKESPDAVRESILASFKKETADPTQTVKPPVAGATTAVAPTTGPPPAGQAQAPPAATGDDDFTHLFTKKKGAP